MSGNKIALTSSLALLDELLKTAQSIGSLSESVVAHKKSCWNLARRIKLLSPLLEEIREIETPLPPLALMKFQELRSAFNKAKDIMSECQDGSRLYLILEREAMEVRFRSLASDLSKSLSDIPLELLAVSDEIQEQLELVRQQLKRHKHPQDSQEELLQTDLKGLLTDERGGSVDIGKLEMLMKLGLNSIPSILKEMEALEKERNGARERGTSTKQLDQALHLLSKLHLSLGGSEADLLPKRPSPRELGASSPDNSVACPLPIPPEDFRCPISLEIMRDPVIVSTGQTYDRTYIEQWLKDGHKTCPKTQQVLSNPVLIPNYSLRSLIQQWCETNNYLIPNKQSKSNARSSTQSENSSEIADRALILNLKARLQNSSLEGQRNTVAEIRSLAKRNVANRTCIAEVGAIPLLVSALKSSDLKIQEHAVTALLNLSINDPNKNLIVAAGAVDSVVEVLNHGTMEARENAAATLFSLSVIDEHKISIGQSGAIPALVGLLQKGTARGKKDAATALFNLSIFQGNKARAVRAGIIPPLMDLLVDHNSGMVDEALAILAVLVNSPEGRNAISSGVAIPLLVYWIKNGSSRTKENAASVLLSLCQNGLEHTNTALRLNAPSTLSILLRSGTSRAKRKASQLLQHFNDYEQYTREGISFLP